MTRALYIALWQGDEIIGIQAAGYRGEREPFTAIQRRIARGIAQLASVALINAQLVEELERVNRIKSDFVATMSHELRTPLHIIMGYNELLLTEDLGPLVRQQAHAVYQSQKSARALLELIDATLDLSRLERGQVLVAFDAVDPALLLSELKSETGELQQKRALRFVWELSGGLPALYTDAAKLKLALKNLIDNAVKFTPTGRVSIGAIGRDDGVEFIVADTGIGIAAEVLPIIFEPFRQGDSTLTRAHGGVGLGLYIVRELVTLLGGSVRVESQVGSGTTFRVWVPGRAATTRASAQA